MEKSCKPDDAFIVRALVAGEIVPPELMTVADGWHLGPPKSAIETFMEITRDAAVDAFEQYYTDYVNDGLLHPPEEGTVEMQLSKVGWPSLKRLMAEQPKLYEAFIAETAYDFLIELLRSQSRNETGYALCHVDQVSLGDHTLTLRGLSVPF